MIPLQQMKPAQGHAAAMLRLQGGMRQAPVLFGEAAPKDLFQRRLKTTPEAAPGLRFGSVTLIPDQEIQDHNRELRRIIGQLQAALTAGPVREIQVPDKEQFLAGKGITLWDPQSRQKILDAARVVQVGSDPDNLYLVVRPAGSPSPVFTVYGLRDNLRLAASIRAGGVGDALQAYYDVSGADTPQTGGQDAQGYWQPPVSYTSIDPGVFDDTAPIRQILEQNGL